jgi:hypothetical protein
MQTSRYKAFEPRKQICEKHFDYVKLSNTNARTRMESIEAVVESCWEQIQKGLI